MNCGQVFEIKCLGQKFIVTVDDEFLEETGEYGLWTDQEFETLDACDWTYSLKKGLLFRGEIPKFPIEEFKRI